MGWGPNKHAQLGYRFTTVTCFKGEGITEKNGISLSKCIFFWWCLHKELGLIYIRDGLSKGRMTGGGIRGELVAPISSCLSSWLCLCFLPASLRNIWKSTTCDSGTFFRKLTRMETWRSLWQPSGEPWYRCAPESMARRLSWQGTALGKPFWGTTATSQPCWWCSN